MATKKKNQNVSYTTVDGRRVTIKNGVKTYSEPKKTVSYGTNSSGAKLSSTGSKLDTSAGQTLKDYSIAWGGGGSSGGGVTADSNDAKNYEESIGSDLKSYTDELEKLRKKQEREIERERAALELRRKTEIGDINSNYDNQRTATEFTQSRETGEASMAMARSGGYLGNTASQAGVLQNLAVTQKQELNVLEQQRDNALRLANNAYEDRDFELAKEGLKNAREIEQEIYNRTLEYNDRVAAELEKIQKQESTNLEQQQIYNAIATTGSENVADIFAALDGSVPIENIKKFLDNLIPSSSVEGFKFTGTNTARLLGAGMSQDDIIAFNEYVNENGYDDTIRAALSPAARSAADKIFREINEVSGGSGGGSSSPNEELSLIDLKRVKDTYGVLFPVGVTWGEITAFFKENGNLSPDEQQEIIDTLFGPQTEATNPAAAADTKIEFTREWFEAAIGKKNLKNVADNIGASSFWTWANADINRLFNNQKFLTLLKERVDALRGDGATDDQILLILAKK